MIKAIEQKIETIEKEVAGIEDRMENKNIDPKSYGTAFETVFGLLKNPVNVWKNSDHHGKRLIAKLVFTKNPVYDRVLGYGTEDLSIGIKLFELIPTNKSLDVEVGRLNPRPKK